jgi:acyl carrier protein
MNENRERLMRCFQAVFPNLSDEEISHASPASIAEWDSVATITLVGVIEEEFGNSVDPEEIENFVSFDLILDYLANSGKSVS